MASNIKDKEAFQRLNFLYQAAHCVLAQNPENVELARFYCLTQKTIAKRLVLRQDPSVKRTMCKKCYALLIPGVTATVRQRKGPRRQRATIVRCLSCGETKKFVNNPKHQLWVDQPEAQLENKLKIDVLVLECYKNRQLNSPKKCKLWSAGCQLFVEGSEYLPCFDSPCWCRCCKEASSSTKALTQKDKSSTEAPVMQDATS